MSGPAAPQEPQRLLFLAGVPGAGKSSLASFLESRHAFVHYDLERFPEGWSRPDLKPSWNVALEALDPGPFVAALRRAHPGRNLVLDWGFPVRLWSQLGAFIRVLAALGFRLLWLHAEKRAAQEAFIRRGTVPVERFEEQMADIEAAGLPGSIPEFELLEAFAPDGRHRDPAELYRQLFGPGLWEASSDPPFGAS